MLPHSHDEGVFLCRISGREWALTGRKPNVELSRWIIVLPFGKNFADVSILFLGENVLVPKEDGEVFEPSIAGGLDIIPHAG